MSFIELGSNRSKGQNGYICPVVRYSGRKDTAKCKFPIPKPGDEHLARRSKFFVGTVDLAQLGDGWYWYTEATHQGKMDGGVVKVEGGCITEQLDTVEDLLVLTCTEYFPSLQPLTGSEKQIKWARSIRAKVMLKLWEDGYDRDNFASLPAESKWWIESASTELKPMIEGRLAQA